MSQNRLFSSVVYDMSYLRKRANDYTYSRIEKGVFQSKIGDLGKLLDRNYDMTGNGQVCDIDVQKTFTVFEKKEGNFKIVIDTLKLECRNLKGYKGFSKTESYIDNYSDDPSIGDFPYLRWLEETIINFESFKIPRKKKEVKEEVKKVVKEEVNK